MCPLFSMMCDGDATVVDHQMGQILGVSSNGQQRYFRLQVRLDTANDDMDDSSSDNVRTIKLLAEDLILKNRELLESLATSLMT